MEEKIKINLPQSIFNILSKDMEMFEFYKNDHTLNRNSFLNTLIINYYEIYEEKNRYIKNSIIDSITNYSTISTDDLNHLGNVILHKINAVTNDLENKRYHCQISFRPTKQSKKTIEYIQSFLLDGNSLSSYFRTLFASYSKLSQDQREKIIFKRQFDLIQKAITEHRMIYINTIRGKKHLIAPYAVASSKEELFNYLLATLNKEVFTFRISRIEDIILLNDHTEFNPNQINTFNQMIKFGPQYAYRGDYQGEVIVQLSKLGIKFFESMYIHRPIPSKIEGDLYYFNCSLDQVTHYFKRFGSAALILAPAEASERMKNFYNYAYQRYKSYYETTVSKNEDELL